MTTMGLSSKLVSIATIPAAFVLAFVLAFLAMGAADAFAQPAAQPTAQAPAAQPTEVQPTEAHPTEVQPGPAPGEARPPHGFAQPSDDVPPGPDAAAGHGATGHDSASHGGHADAAGHHDPSQHFNFFTFNYRGKDVAGGKLGDGQNAGPHGVVPGAEEPMSPPFVFMVLNFLILLAILVWKGKPAAQQLAAERHDQIKNALDEAAKLRTQAAAKLAEYEARLKDADAEIKKMVDGMRADAEADKQRILDNAAKQSAQMKRDAELRIAAEIELARAVLTREVTMAASAATEKLLREKMMPGDQANLVASFISQVQAGGPAQPKERT